MPERTMSRPAFRHRRLAAAGGLLLAAALTLTGCTGDDKTSTGSAASPSATTTAIPSPTPTDSPSPSASPAHRPSSKAPAPAKAAPTPDPDGDAAAAPAPKRTHGSTTGSSRSAACEILSNAGNCYEAGQFCRTRDVGSSTHDAHGRLITCGTGSGRPRWHH
ncbi:hypothetical protein [Streptomyces sp. UNOC14_S4]|uniref:hypothetical protein n=1 Tax=Streptomyces sp. UNOC14_S4 TaxID=2872340 RepID=UPI0023B0030B|nr:hypothetical protein [Streptomyces sp. UNOC14_S4]MCC3770651.1 hypothetical protein [Streptomyces sp. UNOC14_S4]